jgi:hypothetical protein
MMNNSVFSHLLMTRFNVPKEHRTSPDTRWLIHRFDLFHKFCYPSVKSQSNQNFKWLVFFDVNTPAEFKEKIKGYAKWSQFVPCFIKQFTEELYIPFILENIHADSEYLITSRVDNDDALAIHYIQKVQYAFKYQQIEFINFDYGFVYDVRTGKLFIRNHYINAFVSLIEKIDNIKTVYKMDHRELGRLGNVIRMNCEPMWLQIIHGDNLSNKVRTDCYRVPLTTLNDRVDINFDYRTVKESSGEVIFEKFINKIPFYFLILFRPIKRNIENVLRKVITGTPKF